MKGLGIHTRYTLKINVRARKLRADMMNIIGYSIQNGINDRLK